MGRTFCASFHIHSGFLGDRVDSSLVLLLPCLLSSLSRRTSPGRGPILTFVPLVPLLAIVWWGQIWIKNEVSIDGSTRTTFAYKVKRVCYVWLGSRFSEIVSCCVQQSTCGAFWRNEKASHSFCSRLHFMFLIFLSFANQCRFCFCFILVCFRVSWVVVLLFSFSSAGCLFILFGTCY